MRCAGCSMELREFWCKEEVRPSSEAAECLGAVFGALSGVGVCTPLPDPPRCRWVPQQHVEEPLPCHDCRVHLAPGLTCDRADASPEETSACAFGQYKGLPMPSVNFCSSF